MLLPGGACVHIHPWNGMLGCCTHTHTDTHTCAHGCLSVGGSVSEETVYAQSRSTCVWFHLHGITSRIGCWGEGVGWQGILNCKSSFSALEGPSPESLVLFCSSPSFTSGRKSSLLGILSSSVGSIPWCWVSLQEGLVVMWPQASGCELTPLI